MIFLKLIRCIILLIGETDTTLFNTLILKVKF
nr:hypothetical protein [Aquimarina sp. BL5]